MAKQDGRMSLPLAPTAAMHLDRASDGFDQTVRVLRQRSAPGHFGALSSEKRADAFLWLSAASMFSVITVGTGWKPSPAAFRAGDRRLPLPVLTVARGLVAMKFVARPLVSLSRPFRRHHLVDRSMRTASSPSPCAPSTAFPSPPCARHIAHGGHHGGGAEQADIHAGVARGPRSKPPPGRACHRAGSRPRQGCSWTSAITGLGWRTIACIISEHWLKSPVQAFLPARRLFLRARHLRQARPQEKTGPVAKITTMTLVALVIGGAVQF